MANTFLKPTKILRTALAVLERQIVLPRTVWAFGRADFAGAKDDTVTLRLPALLTARDYEWRTRNNPIVVDDLTERGVDVKLNKHPYSAVGITDEQLELDIVSFTEQVSAPQMRAVAERLEGYIATALGAAPWKETVTYNASTGSAYSAIIEARRVLNNANVPMSDRQLVMGTAVEAAFLNDEHLNKFDQSGSDDALREAQIGRIGGMTAMVSNAIPEDEMYAYHRSAIAWAQMAPRVPEGATAGASESLDQLAMRWLRDYDPNFLRDRSVVSAFAGVTPVTDGPLIDADGDTQVDDASVVRGVKFEVTGL